MVVEVRTEADLARWVSRRIETVKSETALGSSLERRSNGGTCGSTSLFDIDKQNRRMEVGHTWIGRSQRRRAASTESKLLLFTHAFKTRCSSSAAQDRPHEPTFSGLHRMVGSGSRRSAAQLYFFWEDGSIHDRVVYSVIDREWPRVKERLIGFLSRKS